MSFSVPPPNLLHSAMVSTLNKTARPVSAPLMSPISIGEPAPSAMVTSVVQVEHRDLATSTSAPSHSGENKVEVKAESCVTGTFKMQSVAREDSSEIKVRNRKRVSVEFQVDAEPTQYSSLLMNRAGRDRNNHCIA